MFIFNKINVNYFVMQLVQWPKKTTKKYQKINFQGFCKNVSHAHYKDVVPYRLDRKLLNNILPYLR